MGKKKVLIVSCTPFYGGAEIFVKQIFPILEDQFDIYYQLRSYDLYNELSSKNKYLLDEAISFWGEINFAHRLIVENKIDIVLLNGNRAIYMAPFLPRSVCKIAYKHTSIASTPKLKRCIYYPLITMSFLCCHKIVGVSRMVVDEIKGFKHKKMVIYNGVLLPDLKPVSCSKKIIDIVYVGRLEREKGIMEALEAFQNLTDYPVVLNIAGTGKLNKDIQQWIQGKEISNVCLLGQVKDVYGLLQNCDIFVLPTYYEAISLSILEAMACGLPVVASRVGGIPEVVKDGVTGFLVTPKDVSQLRKRLERLIEDEKLRAEMGQEGRERVMTFFSIEKTRTEITQLLKTLGL